MEREGSPRRRRPSRRLVIGGLVIATLATSTVIARKRGYSGMGGVTIVRCRHDHLFSTIWIPGVSIKSIRLGWNRFQWCPIGHHWTLVKPVKEADLSEEELLSARDHRDIRLP